MKDNFQRWVHRWRMMLTAKRIVICKTRWIIESFNVNGVDSWRKIVRLKVKFQRWVSGFVHWWKTVLTAKCSGNCTNDRIFEHKWDRPSEGRLQIRSWDVMAFVWRVSLNIGRINWILRQKDRKDCRNTNSGHYADSHNWHRNALRWLVDGSSYLWTCNVATLKSKLVFVDWDQSQP